MKIAEITFANLVYITTHFAPILCFGFVLSACFKIYVSLKLFKLACIPKLNHKKSFLSVLLALIVNIVVDCSWVVALLETMNFFGQNKFGMFVAYFAWCLYPLQFYPLLYFLQNIWQPEERFVWHQKLCFLVALMSTCCFLFELVIGSHIFLRRLPDNLIQLINILCIGIPGTIYVFWISLTHIELPRILIFQMRLFFRFFLLYTAVEAIQGAIMFIPQLNLLFRNDPFVPLASSLCLTFALMATVRMLVRFPIVNLGYVVSLLFPFLLITNITAGGTSRELAPLSFPELAKLERVSKSNALYVRNAPQYEALTRAFTTKSSIDFTTTPEKKSAKDQFLLLMQQIPEFRLFICSCLIKKMPLHEFDDRFPKQNYFDVWPGRIFLGSDTPQFHAKSYLNDENTKKSKNTNVLKNYTELANAILKRAKVELEKIDEELVREAYFSIPGFPKAEGDFLYFKTLFYLENFQDQNPQKSLLYLKNTLETRKLTGCEELRIRALYCMVLYANNAEAQWNEEISEQADLIWPHLQKLPIEIRYDLLILIATFYYEQENEESLMFCLENLRNIIDLPFFEEVENTKLFIIKLYHHLGQHETAISYMSESLEKKTWSEENRSEAYFIAAQIYSDSDEDNSIYNLSFAAKLLNLVLNSKNITEDLRNEAQELLRDVLLQAEKKEKVEEQKT